MKTYYGNHLGMVITGGDHDPEGRGRCQIYVPHIMPTIYDGLNKEGNDTAFNIVGDGLSTAMNSDLVDKLRKILPWAECAAPIVGSAPSVINGSESARNTGTMPTSRTQFLATQAEVSPEGTTPNDSPNLDTFVDTGEDDLPAVNQNPSSLTNHPGMNMREDAKDAGSEFPLPERVEKFLAIGTTGEGEDKREVVSLNYEGTPLAFIRSGAGVGQSTTSWQGKDDNGKTFNLNGDKDIFIVAPTTDSNGKYEPGMKEKYPLGSAVTVYNPETGKTVRGIIGDNGKVKNEWGEVSAGMARALGIEEKITKKGLGFVGSGAEQGLEITVEPGNIVVPPGSKREEYEAWIADNNTPQALESAQTTASTLPITKFIATNGNTIIHNPTSFSRATGKDTNNQALGMFGYAGTGTTAWVFFREGNPLFPVYFAASYGKAEWKNQYSYASSGLGAGEGGTGAIPGTEKMTLNSYGGGFESTSITMMPENADSGLEPNHSFQVYGKDGSNLLFAKGVTQLNSTYDFRQQMGGDYHEITQANKETRVVGDKNTYVEQDIYETIGNWSSEAIAASDEIQQYINEAMEIKSKV